MRCIRLLLGLWSVVASTAIGTIPIAHAEVKPKTVTNVDSIRRFMEKGQALFLAGQYQRASEIFEAGYELHPYSAFLFNAGVALEKSGKLEEAIEHFKKYLEVDPKAPDAPAVTKRITKVEQLLKDAAESSRKQSDAKLRAKDAAAQKEELEAATKSLVIIETEPPGAPLRVLRRARGESTYLSGAENPDWQEVLSTESPTNASLDVGQYHVQVDRFQDFNPGETAFEVLAGHVLQVKVNLSQGQFMGHLRVVSNVEQAQVYLDDPTQKQPAWGRTPFADFISVGEHSVLVTATGYEPIRRSIKVARGEQQEVNVALQRLPYGTLRVSSNVADAHVALDGEPVGTFVKANAPLEIAKVPAGKHRLRVTADGRKPAEGEIDVPRGQVQPIRAQLVVLPPRGAAYTQAIIGGVLLGAGIYVGVESNRLYDEVKTDRHRGVLASDDSRMTRGKIYSISADIAFLSATALAGLSTYNFLRDPLPPSRLVFQPRVEFDAQPSQPLRRFSTLEQRTNASPFPAHSDAHSDARTAVLP